MDFLIKKIIFMKLSFRYPLIFAIALLNLLAGVLNYLLFQPDIILLKVTGIHITSYDIKNNFLKYFFTSYFSDITWCISLCFIAFALLELNYVSVAGKMLILAVPFISEAMQYFRIINGTFDWFDILTYALILSVFYSVHFILKSYTHEKS